MATLVKTKDLKDWQKKKEELKELKESREALKGKSFKDLTKAQKDFILEELAKRAGLL